MNTFFRRLPLPVKLMLIGFIPLFFIIYLTYQLYQEKKIKVDIIGGYIERIQQSGNISMLIKEMQDERKLSFDKVVRRTGDERLKVQRIKTDATLKKMEQSNDQSLKGFEQFTYLHKLPEIRAKVDSGTANSDILTHYYSNMIFRLNTLTGITLSNNSHLQPVYNDIRGQKLLSEMIAYLNIMRTNIYNVLYTQKYMMEVLMGTIGTYDVYTSYETEFLMKAPAGAVQSFKDLRAHSELKPTLDYIHNLFTRFQFDSTYNADDWWSVSDRGIDKLSGLQQQIWNHAVTTMDHIYQRENEKKNRALGFLIIAIVLVVSLVAYTIIILTHMLGELKVAAEKIANGAHGVQLQNFSQDAIGSLAQSILKMDASNKQLAQAADAIGKGNFTTAIQPRSKEDMLGHAIVQMQSSLQQFSERMELLVNQRTGELERSNNDLQQFAHVASHDLKEPLRKIKTFGSRLSELYGATLPERGQLFLDKMQGAANRMSAMIDGVLDYSIVNATDEPLEPVNLNHIVSDILSDLELLIQQKKAHIHYHDLPVIQGIPVLIHQLFYNLINNALKFSKEDAAPVITLSSQTVGNMELPDTIVTQTTSAYYKIKIADNGIGFNTEQGSKLFQIFTRLNARDKYEGTGLGLALCKKIVDRHNGYIFAEGQEGNGAVFTIYFPAKW